MNTKEELMDYLEVKLEAMSKLENRKEAFWEFVESDEWKELRDNDLLDELYETLQILAETKWATTIH